MDAKQRRIYAAVLDSLADSFKLWGETGRWMTSFNASDVEKMLRAVSKEIEPQIKTIR
jgi:hypothetical protein